MEPFSSITRGVRGSDAGDLVDSMVETRVILEKIKALESRMKYQIEKLIRVAQEPPSSQLHIIDGNSIFIFYFALSSSTKSESNI